MPQDSEPPKLLKLIRFWRSCFKKWRGVWRFFETLCRYRSGGVWLVDSCFFSLLLVAFIVWKLKQRYDVYRRGQVRTPVNHHSTTAVVVLVVCSVFIAHQHSNADTLYWYRNSVCPSVCHAPLLYQNGLRYRHSLFSLCYPDHSSFPGTKHLCEIPMVVTALNTCACIQCIRLCWPVSGCMWEMIQDRAIVMDKEVFPSLVCHCGTRCRSLFVTNLWQWRSSAHIWRLLFRRAYLA